MKKTDVLVIGSGAAGNCAAFAARRADPALRVTILGREGRAEYSAPALPDYLSGELPAKKLMVRAPEEYASENIQALLEEAVTEVRPEEKTVRTASGGVYSYEKLIFATGSVPIRLRKMEGTGLPGNFVMKTMDDVEAMAAYPGKRAVVVGSGAIGLEGSMALKARGYESVTMVEALEWLSPKSLDVETSDKLTEALNGFGVEVLTGEAVEGVLGEERVTGVKTSRRTIPCDLILWGIGMRPEVALAKACGVETGPLGGIRVDSHMRTNLPDVYACGDCVESADRLSGEPALHLFWEPAQRGGTVAGENCAGLDKRFDGSTAIFLTHKGGLSVTAFGKTREALGDRGLVLEENRAGRYRRLLFEDGKLAGAQMVNTMEDVDLLLNELQRNAVIRENAWDLRKPVPGLEEMSVLSYLDHLKRERRVMVK